MDTPSFTDPPRGAGPILMTFFFSSYSVTWDLSFSFGHLRDLLPLSGWFFVRVVLRVDVIFDVLTWGGEFYLLLLRHLDLLNSFLLS